MTISPLLPLLRTTALKLPPFIARGGTPDWELERFCHLGSGSSLGAKWGWICSSSAKPALATGPMTALFTSFHHLAKSGATSRDQQPRESHRQEHTLESGALPTSPRAFPGGQVGTQASSVRLMLDPLNPVSLPSVTHSFNKYLLSAYGVLGTRDKVFAHVELAGE